MGGGNANGPDGSYLIKLTPDRNTQVGVLPNARRFDIIMEQYPYNFRANAHNPGQFTYIMTIGQSSVDPNRMYVGMNDGSFFYSNDAGINWARSPQQLATNNYAMALSKQDKNLVYVAGDQNAGIYKSTDGGITFTHINPLSANSPSEYILDMEWNPDESLLFVGGMSGAYAYEPTTDQWYDILGQYAPMSDYRDVDYISEINTMRWSVWGRGIFDLRLGIDATDTDDDGLVDIVDLDDDNDGILDTVEDNCSSSINDINITFDGVGSGSKGTNDVGRETNLYLSEGNAAGNWWEGVFFRLNDEYFPTYPNIGMFHNNASEDWFYIDVGIHDGIATQLNVSFDTRYASGSGGATWIMRAYRGTGFTPSQNVDITGLTEFSTNSVVFSATSQNQQFQIPLSSVSIGEQIFVRWEVDLASSDRYAGMDNIVIQANPSGRSSSCDEDRDGDGIINSLDLDSDNDGVNDVDESGGRDANGDGFADGTPDRRGRPVPAGNAAGTSQDGPATTSGVDTDGDGILASADGDTENYGDAATDTDGDGIADSADLDDDNDGILDTVEGACSSSINGINITFDGVAGVNDVGTVEGLYLSEGNTAGNWWEGVFFRLNNEYFTTYPNIGMYNGNAAEDWFYVDAGTHDGLASQLDVSFDAKKISRTAIWILKAYYGTGFSPAQNVDITGLTDFFSVDVSFSLTAENKQYQIPLAAVPANSQIFLRWEVDQGRSTGYAGIDNIIIQGLSGITTCDTDNDGIINSLDLDSDGDGCSDALEGNASLTLSDLNADGSIKGNVETDPASSNYGLPLLAGNGQQIGSSQDAGNQSSDCPPRLSGRLQILLEGPFDANNTWMDNDYVQLGELPQTDPFSLNSQMDPSLLNLTNGDALVDWLLIELRDANDPASVLDSQAVLVQRNGNIINTAGSRDIRFEGLSNTNYYVSIDHISHLKVMTATAIDLSTSPNIDFTDPNTPVYSLGAAAMKNENGIMLLWGGDANNDGRVNAVDKNLHWAPQNGNPFSYGNTPADFNMDGNINALDINLFWRRNNSKIEQIP